MVSFSSLVRTEISENGGYLRGGWSAGRRNRSGTLFMYFHHCWAVDKDTGWTVCLRIVRGGLPLSSRSVMVSLPLRDIVELFNYFFLNPTVGRLGLRCWAARGLLLPWTKKKKRTILEIRGEKNAVPRVISCSIRRDQRRASPIRDCPRLLPCADRTWSSMISHVEQRSSRRESRGWFFFFCPR